MSLRTKTVYESSKAEGFNLEFPPVEDTIQVKKIEGGFEVRYLCHDEDPVCDPRDNDNLGVMACFHKRYNLGDKTDLHSEDYSGWNEMEKALIKQGAYVILPLYMMDHSGLTINTTGFEASDPQRWDWGQIGFIYVTKEKARQEYGKLGKKTRETATKVLLGEVEEYDTYQRGEVFGTVKETFDENKVQTGCDHVWGHIGLDWAKQALNENFDWVKASAK